MSRMAIAAACAALAACNSGGQVSAENATAEEVAQKVEAAGAGETFVRPGKWQSRVTLEDLTIPGMPPAMAEQMKAARSQPQVQEQCLRPQDTKRPNEAFFAGGKDCRYERFDMGGGKIDAVMTCSGDGGGPQKMTMTGTYSPDSYDMRMSIEPSAADGNAAVGMKMRIESKRIGECTGTER